MRCPTCLSPAPTVRRPVSVAGCYPECPDRFHDGVPPGPWKEPWGPEPPPDHAFIEFDGNETTCRGLAVAALAISFVALAVAVAAVILAGLAV